MTGDVPELVVVGAGVAGLAAAVHGARLGLRVRLFDRMGPGGQVINAGSLDAVPGLPPGQIGADLVGRLTEQAIERDVEVEFAEVLAVDPDGDGFTVRTDGDAHRGRSVVLALGSAPVPLGLPGEVELEGLGVSHCAQCDGDLFRDQDVVVVGGGDGALEAAAHLAERARSVIVVHRGTTFGGAAELVRRATEPPNVAVRWASRIRALEGDGRLTGVVVAGDDGDEVLAATGLFPEIGRRPLTEPVAGLVALDDGGWIVVDAAMATSRPGVFAAGAARAGASGQIVTSMADGVVAAASAAAWLRSGGATP